MNQEFEPLVKNLFAILAVASVILILASVFNNREKNEVCKELHEDIDKCTHITDCILVDFHIERLSFMLTYEEKNSLNKALREKKQHIAQVTGLRVL